MMAISLKAVVDVAGDEISCWLNPETGEILAIHDDEMRIVEDEEPLDDRPDWEREHLLRVREVAESGVWRQLPGKFDIHEWQIMQDFSQSRNDGAMRDQLLNAVHGSGAFRHFKSTIDRLGIQDDWYRFRDETLERIAREWLEEEKLTRE